MVCSNHYLLFSLLKLCFTFQTQGKNFLSCAILQAANYTLELNIMHINLAYHTSTGTQGVKLSITNFIWQKERKPTVCNQQVTGQNGHVCCSCHLILMHLLGIYDQQPMFLSGKFQREVLGIRSAPCNRDIMNYLLIQVKQCHKVSMTGEFKSLFSHTVLQ